MTSTDTGLVAIFLLTHSRPGARLVFHYPPNPVIRPADGTLNGSDRDEVAGNVESLRNGFQPSIKPRPATYGASKTAFEPSIDGSIFGISEDSLEKILSPGRWCDRKKFEISLQGLTFVGHPIYADQDGNWSSSRANAAGSADDRPVTPTGPSIRKGNQSLETGSDQLGVTITEPTPVKSTRDFTHVPESLDSHGGPSLATSMNSASSTSAPGPEPLTAFHVVFALSNFSNELQDGFVQDSYQHIAKKLSKALCYCQKQSSYVGVESRRLTALKTKSKQQGVSRQVLCDQMVESSELAWALKEIYEKISIGGIAGFRLNGMEMAMSLQLQKPILNDETPLDRHGGIILLEDKDALLRELSHPDASPLAYFIREHTPTKSLQKQAAKLGMSTSNILYLAQHLIKWRKARTISPLHPRNSYVVSREAPIDQLESYIGDYARRYPGLPSLPQLLKVLSGRPVQFGVLIRSRDHRAPYMDMLGYLARHKFVEQLKTSGWLQAPPTVRKSSTESVEPNKNKRPLSVVSLLSPQLRPLADDDAVSISSERTAIPVSIADTLKRQDDAARAANAATSQPAVAHSGGVKIVKDPSNPTNQDLLCLEHVRATVEDGELRDRLPSLYHYFDGEAALEDIAAREGLKRSVLDYWLDSLQEQRLLLKYRHL
jgi:hypothetical protein